MNKQTPHSLGCTIKGMTRTSYHKLHCLQQRDGFSYNSQSPSQSRVWAGPEPLHLEALGKGPSCSSWAAAASSAISSGCSYVSTFLWGHWLGCLIRELGRWLLEKLLELLLEVCELGSRDHGKLALL